MIKKIDKNAIRQKRHTRVRGKISGTAERPRLSVYRSTNHIYAQLIDDVKGVTLVSCSTMAKDMVALVKEMTKGEAAKCVGEKAPEPPKPTLEEAMAAGINEVVFDRGGYLYTGRVKSLADGAREAGLKF